MWTTIATSGLPAPLASDIAALEEEIEVEAEDLGIFMKLVSFIFPLIEYLITDALQLNWLTGGEASDAQKRRKRH